ncbi:MAG: hypothetical protein SGILL_005677 [Bacillariaceae sp.]
MASSCENGQCLIKHAIFDEGAEFGFVYTSNNTIPNSNVNFFALDVPDDNDLLVELASFVMTSLAEYAAWPGLNHREICHGPTTAFALKKIEDPERLAVIFSRYMWRTERSTEIFELVPLFPYDDPKDWGKVPKPFPKATRVDLTTVLDILDKWRSQVIYCIPPGYDKKKENQVELPKIVTLKIAMEVGVKHQIDIQGALVHDTGDKDVEHWDTNWRKRLFPFEIALVMKYPKYFQWVANIYLNSVPTCSFCNALYEPKNYPFFKCGGCHQTYYCSREHHAADKDNHKFLCQMLRRFK